MHTPQSKIYDLAETSTFGIFRGRNVRGRNVRAEMSVAEMSVAEMSYIRHARTICTDLHSGVVLLLLTFYLLLLPLWESVIVLCSVVRYFMSILVL